MTLPELSLWWLVVPGGLLALALTLFNLLAWPRGRPDGRAPGRVSVLIPARNEVRNIEASLRHVAASRHPVEQIVVYDDGSTDGTGEVLARLRGELPALEVVDGEGLPAGWVGKPHACHQLGRRARGEVLVFVDADTRLTPEAIGRLGSLFDALGADVVTAVPRQDTGSFAEDLLLPLLHLTYTSWLPLPLIWRSRDPRFLAANGQVLAVRAEAYARVGGFEAVRSEVVDDMAFCRRAKEAGLRVVFADGHDIARCRMYEDARQVWEGFSKNLYEGLGESPLALLGVLVLYGGAFIAPYVALAAGLAGVEAALWPGALGVGVNLALRGALALRHRHSPLSVLLHPLGVLALLAIALNSWRWSRSGRIRWAGRTYLSRQLREGRHAG